MRSVVLAAIVVIGLLVAGLLSSGPSRSAALGATPGEGTPAASPVPTPAQLCSSQEIALGESVTRFPPGPPAGVVTPWGINDQVLYVSVMTLPPHACVEYRRRDGGVVLFVQQGTIVYTTYFTNNAVVLKGDSDSIECAPIVTGCDTVRVLSGTSVTLHANEWITQDREAWYTFRNSGHDNVIVSIASFVVPPWEEDPCSGGCRQP